jgi:hypothetical protein
MRPIPEASGHRRVGVAWRLAASDIGEHPKNRDKGLRPVTPISKRKEAKI